VEQIYLDYNASTPIADDVAEAMLPYLSASYGNPSSMHWAGAPAKRAVEAARRQIASLLGATQFEIIFNSGGTEANNHALTGVFFANRDKPVHIVISAVEHPAVAKPCEFLRSLGATVTVVPVDSTGLVAAQDIASAITPDTRIVSVMHANNEVGTVQPIAEISAICRERGVLLHCDAAQSIGKVPVNVDELGVDLLSVAGHKMYAPKGVGALYIRSAVKLEPFMHGAGHESGRRAGTENVLLDVALGAAAVSAGDLGWTTRVRELRDGLWDGLVREFGDDVVLNGHPELRLPNTLNVSFVRREGADILARIPEIAASTGSACHAGDVELSPVLEAMGIAPDVGMGAVRFSLGRSTTAEEIDRTLELLVDAMPPKTWAG